MLLLTKYTVLYKENEICCIILLSLPSRERGLKSEYLTVQGRYLQSLPSRERGLKLLLMYQLQIQVLSLPSRERGLKSLLTPFKALATPVAPFAGAWIEIFIFLNFGFSSLCRSLRGSVD